jgi:hypothetical protein
MLTTDDPLTEALERLHDIFFRFLILPKAGPQFRWGS